MSVVCGKRLFDEVEATEEDEDRGSESEGCFSSSESVDSLEQDNLNRGMDPLLNMDISVPPDANVACRGPTTPPPADPGVPDSGSLEGNSTAPSESCPGSQERNKRTLRSSKTPNPTGAKRRKCAPKPDSSAKDRWRDASDPDSRQPGRIFRPSRSPGVQLDTHRSYSYLELFQLFFSPGVVRTICANTNRNAARKIAHGLVITWLPLSEAEMYRYLGLLISMALLKAHEVRDHWSQKKLYDSPFCRSVMSQSRFRLIASTLHLSDPDEDAENEAKRGTPEYDGLLAIRPIIDSLKNACKAFYHPRQQLSINERTVAYKAQLSVRRYAKTKPGKWGFKLFVLVDPVNGYTCDFNIYCSESASPTGKGLGYDAVVDLLSVPYLGTGYHVYVDNFHASAALFRDLHRRKFGACGTIRVDGQGFPCSRANDVPKQAARGTGRWLREGELLFLKWVDAREVRICSTIHRADAGDAVERRVRNPGRDNCAVLKMPIPTAVREYNKYVGGVDLADSLINRYNIRQKTAKWYKTLFHHFVDVAIVNAFLLHKELAKLKNARPLTQKCFREELCLQLVDFGDFVIKTEPDACALGPAMHLVTSIVDPATVAPSLKATAGRKYCVHCMASRKYMKTNWRCLTCNVPLCVIADRNCFVDWHERNFGEHPEIKKEEA
ncbi:hypothetical protein ANANG_G00004940 [Anguilla anguilla]|uniref:PiggyBac transposable element-derived protein domain-containing protein n=1 Tax=Anguilla anguilla TaxID=7936 RepID=A0A9D3MZU3_ANGAN|nr:hypothetical protein ANANG_G00004940 [Anguilla anguilla]